MSRPRISASGSVGQREGRAEGHLHLLGGALPQHQGVLLLHPRDDRLVEVVAGRADAHAGDDAAEADHGDLGGAAADVDDHVAGRLVDGQPGADRGRHRLLDDVDLAGAGLVAGLLDRALLHRGDAAGHADDHAGLGEVATPVHLLDEVAQHLLGRLEVGDDAVLERPDGGDVVGGAADHALGLVPDREHLAGGGVHGDDGRLVEDDALAADIDQRVGGAEVNGHVSADETVCHSAASACVETCVWRKGPAPCAGPRLRVGSAGTLPGRTRGRGEAARRTATRRGRRAAHGLRARGTRCRSRARRSRASRSRGRCSAARPRPSRGPGRPEWCRERRRSGRWRRPASGSPRCSAPPRCTIAATGPESMNSTSGLVERLALVLGVVLGEQLTGRRAAARGRRGR